MQRKLTKIASLILAIIIISQSNSIFAKAVFPDDVFEKDGMVYFSAELLCYSLQGLDPQALIGKTVDDLVNLYGFGRGFLNNFAANSFGDMKMSDLYKRYLFGMKLTEIYNDEESGFFACVLESLTDNSSIFAVSASGPMDFSSATQETYSNLRNDISKIITASDDEMNIALDCFSNDISNIFGKDWGANDFPLYFRNQCGSQAKVACKYFEEYLRNGGSVKEITATGHSLGAGLAILISTKYNIPAVTFNSVPMLDVTYYRDVSGMSENFHGYDCWNFVDYINECDLLAGRWEKQYKNYILCDNRGMDVKSPVSFSDIWPNSKNDLSFLVQIGTYDKFANKVNRILDIGYTLFCAHDIMTILAYDDVKDKFYLTAREQHRVSDKKSFVKDMGDQLLENADTNEGKEKESLIDAISNTLTLFAEIPNRTLRGSYLVLGTSKGETLSGKALNKSSDVIYGGDGNDTIHARAGDDFICGGNGDDILFGDNGNDVFIYNKGDGTDKICETSGDNILRIYGYGESNKLTVQYASSLDVNIFIDGEKIVSLDHLSANPDVGFNVEYYNNGEKPEIVNVDVSSGNSGNSSTESNTRVSWANLINAYFDRLIILIKTSFGKS